MERPAPPGPRAIRPTARLRPCPRCRHQHARGHGRFRDRAGNLKPRFLCLGCRRTWSVTTGTPLVYLKKPRQFTRMAGIMRSRLSLRRCAAHLEVHLKTAFRWRHRLLAAINSLPQPVLHGVVEAGITCFRYSEKGNHRCSAGPKGAWARRHGTYEALRPVAVLMLLDDNQGFAGFVMGRGMRYRLVPQDRGIFPLHCLAPGAGLRSRERPLYFAPLCRSLGLPYWEPKYPEPDPIALQQQYNLKALRAGLKWWMRRFRGVATRYLQRYVHWFLFLQRQGKPRLLLTGAVPIENRRVA